MEPKFHGGLPLGMYQSWYGDWKEFFRDIDRIEAVTKEDIMRVAKKTLTPSNRTVGMIVTEDPAAEAPAGGAE